MDEVGRAQRSGWTWRAADEDRIVGDAGYRTTDLEGGEGCRYRKVTRAGVPVAFIRIDGRGDAAYLLPPTSEPSWVG